MFRLLAWTSWSSHSEMPLISEPDERDREHQTRRDLGRVRQPSPRLVQDERGDREEEDGIRDSRQDLEAEVAERPLAARRA